MTIIDKSSDQLFLSFWIFYGSFFSDQLKIEHTFAIVSFISENLLGMLKLLEALVEMTLTAVGATE